MRFNILTSSATAPIPTEPSTVEIVDVDTVPGLSETPPASSPKPFDSAAESTVVQEATSLSDVDEDAEGEVDPEYVPSEADGSSMGAVDTPSVATAQESKEEADLVLVDEKLDATLSQDINVSPPTPVTDSRCVRKRILQLRLTRHTAKPLQMAYRAYRRSLLPHRATMPNPSRPATFGTNLHLPYRFPMSPRLNLSLTRSPCHPRRLRLKRLRKRCGR